MRLSLANYSENVPQEHLCNIITYSEAFSDATRLACNEAFSDHWGTRPWSAQSWQDDVTDVPEFLPELSFLLVSPETSEVITTDARAYQYAGALYIHATGRYFEGRTSSIKP